MPTTTVQDVVVILSLARVYNFTANNTAIRSAGYRRDLCMKKDEMCDRMTTNLANVKIPRASGFFFSRVVC